ncbi:MAG TPA: hypothetical protein VGD68_15945 [Streptosporangiaceae bacterium]
MTGRQNSGPGGWSWPGIPGQAHGPGEDDVLEQGGDRRPGPSWWPPRVSRAAAALSVLALLLGLGVGYLAGVRHSPGGPATAPVPSASDSAPPVLIGPTLEQSYNRCSAQDGTALQLGVELINQSATPLTLSMVRVVLPMAGVQVTSVTWGPCGEVPGSTEDPPQDDATDRYLMPGASGWLTVTVKVLVSCPQYVPVQFRVGYLQHGKLSTVLLPGFPDLSNVSYSGCQHPGGGWRNGG